MSPLKCPLCPRVPLTPSRQHNSLRPLHNFSDSSAPALQLLISVASYIRPYAMCFSDIYFSAPCPLIGPGAGFWWLRLLLTFSCSFMKGAPPPCYRSQATASPDRPTVGWVGGTTGITHTHTRVPKALEKTGCTCNLSIPTQHGSSWSPI